MAQVMDVNSLQTSAVGGAGQQQLERASPNNISSPHAHSSFQQQPSQHTLHPHPQHQPSNPSQSLQDALHLPDGHAAGSVNHQDSAQQTSASWLGSSSTMPLPFNLEQFQEHNLPPLRPCDGVYNNANNFTRNNPTAADSTARAYYDGYSDPATQADVFYHPPHSAPIFNGPFEVPAFDDMGSYPAQQFDDVAERVKTSHRSVQNPYRESNGAPHMKRVRSNEMPRPNSANASVSTHKAPSTDGAAGPPVKRQRTLVTAGPDPIEPLLNTPAPADFAQTNGVTRKTSTMQSQPEPATGQATVEPKDKASSNKTRSGKTSGTTTGATAASESGVNTAISAKPTGKIDPRSWANILKYTTPELDLDWSKEPDRQKRRQMQLIIASRVRSDKKNNNKDAQARSAGANIDNANAVAGSSSQQRDANLDAEADASIVGDAAQTGTQGQPGASTRKPSKPSGAKLIKIRVSKPNQPIAPAAPKGQAVAPYPSPEDSAKSDDLAASDQADRGNEHELTPEPEDEELLQLQVARYDALIKLKMLEYQRKRQDSNTSQIAGAESNATPLASSSSRPICDVEFDKTWVEACKADLRQRGRGKKATTFDMQSARRILNLLEVGTSPSESEALFLTGEEAAQWVKPGVYFHGPIITENQQTTPLQKPEEFLDEYPDDHAEVWIQDPEVKLQSAATHCRPTTIEKVKNRLASGAKKHPWNCLELATHFDDGLRPAFLNNEDCRLLTKLKIPGAQEKAARRGFLEGWKEVEKWALVAQAGALTEPHQDSHGYSTFITVNTGPIGFGWLSNPSSAERKEWNARNTQFDGGRWRWVVLKAGQTVYFPSGTVHFVFRLTSVGNTLAYGGHVLRCSQIVRWVKTLLEEQAQPNVTNEDLTQSAPGYLERVEKFVKNARRMGQSEKWGGPDAFEEFMRLKQQFMMK